jgi:hypothetical protein
VDLVDKHDSGNHLCNALSLDNLVDLASELFSNLCVYEGAHDAHNVLTILRPSIGSVDVAESDVLDDRFALVHVAFWKWDICL